MEKAQEEEGGRKIEREREKMKKGEIDLEREGRKRGREEGREGAGRLKPDSEGRAGREMGGVDQVHLNHRTRP